MAVPKQVRDQSAQAEKFFVDLELDGEEPEAGKAAEEAKPKSSDEPVKETTPAARPQPVPVAPVSEHDSGNELKAMTERYRTLQGMYNSEVEGVKTENAELTARMRNMEALLGSLQEEAQTAAPAPSAKPVLSDEELEEYGADTVDMVRRVAAAEVHALTSRIATLENSIQQLAANMNTSVIPQVQRISQTQNKTAEQQFWSDLETAVPDWQEINSDPAFHEWLLTVDPLMGTTRQSGLEASQKARNAARVAAFFSSWKNIGTNANANVQTQQQVKPSAASELEKQVSPGRGRSQSAPTGEEPKVYTSEDISKFYSDVQKGVYKSRQDERNKIERDIFAAQQRVASSG